MRKGGWTHFETIDVSYFLFMNNWRGPAPHMGGSVRCSTRYERWMNQLWDDLCFLFCPMSQKILRKKALKTEEAPHHTWVAGCVRCSAHYEERWMNPAFEIIDDSYFLSCHKTSKESSIKSSLSLVDEHFALLIRTLLNYFVPATKFWISFLDPSSWALTYKSGEADNLHGLDSTSKTQKRTQKEKTKSILFVIFQVVSFLFLMYGSPYWCLAILYRCWSVSCLPATVAIVASATKVQPIWFTEQGFPNSYTHLLLRLYVDLSNMF